MEVQWSNINIMSDYQYMFKQDPKRSAFVITCFLNYGLDQDQDQDSVNGVPRRQESKT